MENRWSHLFNEDDFKHHFNEEHEEEHEEKYEEVQQPMSTIKLKEGERLLQLTLELSDIYGLVQDDLPDGFEGEAFIEHPLVIREREFNNFVKVLHYNNIRYRIEPIQLVYKTVGGEE